ncbi:hypothetical protein Scep_018793 [Stephania cephalantha]|uniref:Uncharacterized protein n=1 Tax=Stephania cephalantha TaxID=152367 RepID=A0AAP0I9K5_9MAGN
MSIVAPTLIPSQDITFETSLLAEAKLIKEFVHFHPSYYYGGERPEVVGSGSFHTRNFTDL